MKATTCARRIKEMPKKDLKASVAQQGLDWRNAAPAAAKGPAICQRAKQRTRRHTWHEGGERVHPAHSTVMDFIYFVHNHAHVHAADMRKLRGKFCI